MPLSYSYAFFINLCLLSLAIALKQTSILAIKYLMMPLLWSKSLEVGHEDMCPYFFLVKVNDPLECYGV